MADRKAVIKNADMSEEMQVDAIDVSTQVRRLCSRVYLAL
jgi:Mn-dependent DtxR family transcriptional regulator